MIVVTDAMAPPIHDDLQTDLWLGLSLMAFLELLSENSEHCPGVSLRSSGSILARVIFAYSDISHGCEFSE